jgi:Subtilase family
MRKYTLPALVLSLLLIGRANTPEAPGGIERRSAPRAVGFGGWAPATEATAANAEASPYVAGEYLVAPPVGTSLAAVARSSGGEVVRPVGRSGFGVVRTDSPQRLAAAGARLVPHARTMGAGDLKKSTTTKAAAPPPPPPTWHLTQLGAATTVGTANWAGWRVAVLDSGVAYETYGVFVQAPGLATVPFADPLDLVEGDGHPNDDHQHGTHITSLIASKGAVPGVVPGVTILPVKVLDADNSGTEYDLIEGLWHAIDHQADVINLSLSFPLGYVPSPALAQALEEAWTQEIVVVAAAGNDSARELSWPAASRIVVSVGGSKAIPDWLGQQAWYSNTSPALDILAPGGDLGKDANFDGYVDGVVAETIDPNDPKKVGYWAFQGSSQSAALVSGVAVQMLAAGVEAHDVAVALQDSAGGYAAWDANFSGTGADIAYLPDAISSKATREEVYVGLMPYLAQLGLLEDPRALVTVVDSSGKPLADVQVIGSMYSTVGVWWPTCTTDDEGRCTLKTWDFLSGGDAWAFRVDAVVIDEVAQRPERAMWGTEGTDILLTALLQSEDTWDLLGIYWPAGTDDELGPLAESWAVVDSGSGLLSSPLGVVFKGSAVSATAVEGIVDVDVDGTGLLSSPLGMLSFNKLSFTGSSMFGDLEVVGIDGSGLLSSPLGFHGTRLYGTGLLSSPLGWSSTIQLGTGKVLGASLEGTSMEAMLADQTGLATADGYSAAAVLIGSGAVVAGLAASDCTSAPSSTADSVHWVP